jgi:asparagine synthase (glutamine-hydrolysing)
VLVLGSSADVARSLPGVSSALHEPALVDLLGEGYVRDAERTVFRDVRRLPAAHTLVCEGNAATALHRHWDFPVPSPIRYRRDDDYLAHFNEVLEEALRDRLRADSAAILLSGGMDSTTLAVAARRAKPGVRFRAFTMTHPGLVQSDDDALSVEAAERIGLVQQVLDLGQVRVPRQLADVPSQPLDESDLAVEREALKPVAAFSPIVIYGEDGDALLQAPTLLGQLRTQPITEVMGAWTRYWWRTGRRPWVGLEWRDRLRRWRHGGEPDRTPWLRAGARGEPSTATGSEHPLRPRSVRSLSSVLWSDLYESLAPASTLAPVLHTLPYVDPRVIAFVFAIPPVPWCQNKHLFRAAMRDDLPAAVLARPKTALVGYLEAQVAQWRTQGGADTPISDRVAPWVDIAAVRRILRSGAPFQVIDAWRVLQLDTWLQHQEDLGA